MSAYLLEEQDEVLRSYYMQLQERQQHDASPRGSGRDQKVPKWPGHHARLSREDDEWWLNHNPDKDATNNLPGLLALTEREYDIVRRTCPHLPEAEVRVLNVSASLERVRASMGVPCLTPRSRMFLSNRGRLLHGVECLRLQSIWFSRDKELALLSAYGERFMADLAGNAMEGCCVSASLMATIVLLSSGEASADPPPALSMLAPPDPVDVSESSDDDDLRSAWQSEKRRRTGVW